MSKKLFGMTWPSLHENLEFDAYLWQRHETFKGDYVGAESDDTPNADDLVVNGTYDLVNLFPAALDLNPFRNAWGNRVTGR